jgi:hypothetical protein
MPFASDDVLDGVAGEKVVRDRIISFSALLR